METIVICASHENFVPERKTPEAMCWDIKAAESLSIAPGEVKLLPDDAVKFMRGPRSRSSRDSNLLIV